MTDLVAFIHNTRYEDLPDQAASDVLRGLTDTLGVAIAASRTELSRIIRDHAAMMFGAKPHLSAMLWQDGRLVSPAGAALANAMTTDALDAHDGSKPTKGHVGCGVVAAALATSGDCDGPELLARIAVGYEVGTRAGIALHSTACDYHTSGAWIALATAAIGARALRLDPDATRHALGIAEYHGPRSQMMRCIDHPTMVKDGSGWGAMAGISAAYLAGSGFTGAPAITTEAMEVSDIWCDLAKRWYVSEQYIKLYPVCRWAQPPVEAALHLLCTHNVAGDRVASVQVETFHEATRLTAIPKTTEEAQYSLPFSVAAAILRGTIGAKEVGPDGLSDPAIRNLAQRVTMAERQDFNEAFPARRFARVHLTLMDGTLLSSDAVEAQGDPEDRLGEDVINAKFTALAEPVLGAARTQVLRANIDALPKAGTDDVIALGDLMGASGR